MPQSSQSLDAHVSGTTGPDGASVNFVTFDAPYLFNASDEAGNLWNVPSILYLAGNISYRQDNQGNMVAMAYNPNMTLPY